eukprot:s1874_g6.t1
MSGATTERGTSRPRRLPNLPAGPLSARSARSARSAFAKRTTEEAGVNYLKGAKVGSVTGYIMVSGTIVGLPHMCGPRGSNTPRTRFDAVSEMVSHRFVALCTVLHCHLHLARVGSAGGQYSNWQVGLAETCIHSAFPHHLQRCPLNAGVLLEASGKPRYAIGCTRFSDHG